LKKIKRNEAPGPDGTRMDLIKDSNKENKRNYVRHQ